MHFLLNLLFGIGAGFLTDYVLARMAVADGRVRVIVAVIVGVIVFMLNLARYVINQ